MRRYKTMASGYECAWKDVRKCRSFFIGVWLSKRVRLSISSVDLRSASTFLCAKRLIRCNRCLSASPQRMTWNGRNDMMTFSGHKNWMDSPLWCACAYVWRNRWLKMVTSMGTKKAATAYKCVTILLKISSSFIKLKTKFSECIQK